MQPIHLAIGLVEGLITAAVLLFVYETRPELIMELDAEGQGVKNKCSLKMTLAAAVVVVGGGLSLFASWSMFGNAEGGYSENMGLDEEDYSVASKMADTAGGIQEKTAFLPDYGFTESDSAAGTTVSGLVGSAIVAAVAVLVCMIGDFSGEKTAKKSREDLKMERYIA